MVDEFIMVAYQGFTYQALGYKTIEGDIPAYKTIAHRHIGAMIEQHRPKPKTPTGGKTHGKK